MTFFFFFFVIWFEIMFLGCKLEFAYIYFGHKTMNNLARIKNLGKSRHSHLSVLCVWIWCYRKWFCSKRMDICSLATGNRYYNISFFFIFSFLIKMFTRKIAIFCIFFGKCCQISESFGPSQLHHEAEKSAYTLVSKAFDMTKANISIPLITTIGKTWFLHLKN